MSPVEVLLLDGATGSGKSTLLNYLRDQHRNTIYVGRKFTDRPQRQGDNDWEFRFVPKIPKEVNEYAFESVAHRYAIDLFELEAALQQGKTYTVSCSNRETIAKLREKFNTVCVYVYRIWRYGEIDTLLASRGATPSDVEFRKAEIARIANDYSQGIGIYDHVIINDGLSTVHYDQINIILAQHGLHGTAML
jgi:guanylate kinase